MVLNRLHLSLMASSSNPASSIFGPSFLTKTRYSTLQSYAATYFPCTSVSGCLVHTKGSLIQFKKVRGACKMMAQQSRSIRCLGSNSTRELVDESKKGSIICSLSLLGFASHPLPSTSRFRISSKSIRPTYVAFAKKMLSTKAMPKSGLGDTSTCESTFVKDGKSGRSIPKPIVSDKQRRRVKTFASHGSTEGNSLKTFPSQMVRKNFPDRRVSASKNVNSVNSTEVLAIDGLEKAESVQPLSAPSSVDSKAEPKSETKPKQRSRNKKKKDEPSVDTLSSSDAVPSKGARRTKRPNGLSTAENSSSVSIPKEEVDLSESPQAVPKKKASKPRKKGKSLKQVNLEEKINGALHETVKVVEEEPSARKAPQKPKSPTVNGIKSIKLKPLYPPTGKSVLVVESLTKAKVIQHYLGDMYEVIPSYGHVRDLAARSGSVRPDDDFSMVWEVPSSAWTHLKSMKVAISGADNLILASDPDREGEAIAWHIIEMLQQQNALRDNMTIARVVFQEVTESAIKSALQSPRDIDVNLVHAYLARRALDYLIGFNISPLLWRKLPGCQSAGRVQSAALSLICDREIEIEEFKPQEYWSVEATFNASNVASNKSSLRSYLTHFDSKRLNQFSIGSETEAKVIEQVVSSSNFKVTAAKKTKVNKNPPTPYITSTLQQDAANKLSFSASYTMKLAQKLYEGVQFADGKAAGLISYMRTDGLHISDEAVKEICSLIGERYGSKFAASSPRKFFKKVKNAQEAHEAIRPTDIRRLPSMLVGALDEDSLKLYTLIWARTMACQMEAARVDQIQLDIGNSDGSISFRAACTAVEFPGFRSVYEDVETRAIRDIDNEPSDRVEIYKILSNLKQGDPLCLGNLETRQHHTQPPPRYSEASLVKKMEELGIGRPSTYASILRVLQDRKYVTAKSRVLTPEFRGRMVSAFLSHYFNEVTDYSFTADMETELDNVSAGSTEWKGLLKDYWGRFSTYCERAGKVHIHQVEKMLERTYDNFLFSSLPEESRSCPSCMEGTLIFKVSRYGAGYFIGCDQHPKCKFIAKTLYGEEDDDEAPQNNLAVEEPKLLGLHPVSGEKVLLKGGPYGSYVQLGEDRKGYLPKRASVSLGNHPVDGLPIQIKISKTGFTIRHRRNIAPVPKSVIANDIDMEKALLLLNGPDVKRSGRPKGKKRLEEEEAVDDI
uniref:DNA topoisomerase n=1 Tax=Chenopodium quinoa TaxID=63459 RepID=A0A803NEA2_CHEQI